MAIAKRERKDMVLDEALTLPSLAGEAVPVRRIRRMAGKDEFPVPEMT